MKEFLALLGYKVRDRVMGFEGVVSSVSFDLYDCVQVVVTPPADTKEGKRRDSEWFDHKRLERLSSEPVMAVPNFEPVRAGEESGPAEKPRLRI